MLMYRVLTIENQRDLLKKRITEYEIGHFQSYCEYNAAKAQGLEDLVKEHEAQLAAYKNVLDWCYEELDALEANL